MDDPKNIDDVLKEIAEELSDVLVEFQPGGQFGPIQDSKEYERLIESLPQPERDLKRELTNFARLLDYFNRAHLKKPHGIADAMFAAAELPIPERTQRIREINQTLMKQLAHGSQSAEFRM
ncbi:MAG TPA: hypothetical protein VN682_12375 [Terriglobales bacterium]|nr:hypothetical protein [Terriglobales bacterium]